jgi:molecular chaperone HtpG
VPAGEDADQGEVDDGGLSPQDLAEAGAELADEFVKIHHVSTIIAGKSFREPKSGAELRLSSTRLTAELADLFLRPMDSPQKHEFQAEVKQLLDLVVHSLYSQKDVFLRELVSNASDALDKLRFAELTTPGLGGERRRIELVADREKRTLSIVDDGIGMTQAEVIANLGTIAKSGTKEFLASLREAKKGEVSPELIGQFGVGFYASFMVADRVTVVTRKAGTETATIWESTGDGSYTVARGERDHQGTTVTLHLKPIDAEQGLEDFTDDDVLRRIVKRYSDFVAYPIVMASKDGETTFNSMKAIWDRPKSEVTEEEYREFYRHVAHDWEEPLATIPVSIEGNFEARALLYVPKRAPFDIYSAEMKLGVQLYVKRVFVMDECKELLPVWLRFVKGVVDAHDLSLNVSREILQKDRQIPVIRKQLVRKVLGALDELKREKREEYTSFYRELGVVLKEGLLDPSEPDRLLELVLAPSTKDAASLTSLGEYVERMKEGQDAIYFLTGPTKEAVASSPLLEAFVAKGYEVLLFSDPVDEVWLERAPEFQGKKLRSIARGEVELGTEDERKKAASELEAKQKQLGDLLARLRVALQDDIKEVRLSSRLTTSASCLVSDERDPTPQMQRLLERLGRKPEKVKRILEVNPDHEIVRKLEGAFAKDRDDPRIGLYAKLLLGQAELLESGQLQDTRGFAGVLAEVMLRGL